MVLALILLFAIAPVVLPFVFFEVMDQKQHPETNRRAKLIKILGWSFAILVLYLIATGNGPHNLRDFTKFFIFVSDFLK